ncbi:MAG TPA: hypothetical protein VHV10_01070, partial [Ktedonobacteraceae bacterium]|nr:hypothetical protein [Ktedonobacteraceae bacterium]
MRGLESHGEVHGEDVTFRIGTNWQVSSSYLNGCDPSLCCHRGSLVGLYYLVGTYVQPRSY